MSLVTSTMGLFNPSDSVIVSHYAQCQDPETNTKKWNSAILYFTTWRAFPSCDMSKCLLSEGPMVALLLREAPLVSFTPLDGSSCF